MRHNRTTSLDTRAKHGTVRAFSMRWKKLINALRRISPVIAGMLVLALLLRYFWRDTSTFTAPLFYAVPLPLHAAGWLWLAGIWWQPKRWKAWLCVALAGSTGILWVVNTNSLRRDTNAPSAHGPRVFFWNIGHTRTVPPALHELLDDLQPDTAALAESEELDGTDLTELRERHPDYQVLQLPDGMICMVNGRVTLESSRALAQRSRVHLLHAGFNRFPGEWRICLADIGPLPLWPRDAILTEIYKIAAGYPRTIIAGDLNTPLDSAAFDGWRESYHHGFADCPSWRGPLETWGYGIPLLAIDHIWMSMDLVPAKADKGARFWQDHSWLMVECGLTASL